MSCFVTALFSPNVSTLHKVNAVSPVQICRKCNFCFVDKSDSVR